MTKHSDPRFRLAGWRLLLALFALGALIAAGCGNDDEGPEAVLPPAEEPAPQDEPAPEEPAPEEPTAEEPTAEEPAPEEPAPEQPTAEEPTAEEPAPEEPAPQEPTPQPLTGDPIKIITIGSFENPAFGNDYTEQSDAVEAHVAVLNATGGIAGHPIEVLICNTQDDPARFLACVRDGIDAEVAAMVGFSSADTADGFALLEQAGIPAIGVVTGDPASLASPNSFPTNNGALGQFFALPSALALSDVSKASIVVPDIGGAGVAQMNAVWSIGLAQQGIQDAGFVTVPADVTDLAPVVAAATAEDTDGVGSSLLGEANARLLITLSDQAPEATVVIPGGLIDPEILEAAGDAAEGAIVVSWYPPLVNTDVPGIARFIDELSTFNPDANLTDQAINYWLAAYIFGNVARDIAASGGTVDGSSVLSALSSMTEVDTLGLTPPIDFTSVFTAFPGLDRMFNPSSVFTVIEDGEQVLLDPAVLFVNPFAPAG